MPKYPDGPKKGEKVIEKVPTRRTLPGSPLPTKPHKKLRRGRHMMA